MRRYVISLTALVLLLPLFFLAYLGLLQVSGNFHEVIAGQLYRSNQPSEGQLAAYIQQNGIKTVINLRGENDRSRWYKDEVSTTERFGITHIDFGMSARRELNLQRVAQLIDIMRNAPKPILIHCKSGSDRTGLASAIYVNRVAGMDEDTAERQLSLRFGHVGIPYLSSAYAMDQTWEEIEAASRTDGNTVQRQQDAQPSLTLASNDL
ncbi:dual specificity protein phosphatase family protein [Agrobacterium larrymoorei]|uniref:dual specificity protein phosphatase family protein n=1 Tax=Agrobacterium larrymoorei TaxID=160699 RepID=UPI0015729E9C|nr:dual specificity protein phosphatase family protein [Agrobacterium larrymoorei]NTJ42695.1 dual specificity protein phosphatase family protein [Agrobacterium larrymoorei]